MSRFLVASTALAASLIPILPLPAHGCSCVMPSDLHVWVDQSEAVFVGSLVEKRDLAPGSFESIYVFEIEEWIKGDAGDVVEVRAPSDGAGCGFEFFHPDQRIGAAVTLEGGELHGGLCSQVDPDAALVVKRGMAPSESGVPHILVGSGWSSSRLAVLDAGGGHVTDLFPAGGSPEFDGTQGLAWCPGGELFVQWTQTHVHVWRGSDLSAVASHAVTGLDGYPLIRDVACRDEAANSIWVAANWEFEAALIEVVSGPTTMVALEGDQFRIGPDFVVAQSDVEGDAIRIDAVTGERTTLHETPPDQLRAVHVAPHPHDGTVAVLETRYEESAPVEATLLVVDATGKPLMRFEIPWEAYSPTWLDDDRISVKAYDFDDSTRSFGFVFDTRSGGTVEIPGWDADGTIASGDRLLGIDGSSVVGVDLGDGEIETLATLPALGAGPLLMLDGADPIEPVTATTLAGAGDTVPPLVAGESEDSTVGSVRWIAGGALVAFLAAVAWLTLAGRRRDPDSS